MNKLCEKKKPYDRNLELLKKYREGDESSGEELARLNTPLVYSVAGRFSGRGADMSDLVESGTLGLVKAIKTFDFSHGTAFSTYAVPLIFGEIRRFLRDDGLIKVSREEKRLCALLSAERERRLSSGEDSDIASIASAVGVSVQDAASALFSGLAVRSLDERAFDDDDTATLGSVIADDEEEMKSFDRLALKMAIEKLSPDHKRLILLRYFRDKSQTETAKLLGLSQVKVSREEKKIMEILRKEMI